VAYPATEVRAAARAARAAGVALPWNNDEGHEVVRILERRGFLPVDRARVDALVERVTRAARISVDAAARERGTEQLAFPLWGRWVDEDPGPEQLAFLV
jgi:hypothetical protein